MQDAQGSGELERLLAEHGGDLMRTASAADREPPGR